MTRAQQLRAIATVLVLETVLVGCTGLYGVYTVGTTLAGYPSPTPRTTTAPSTPHSPDPAQVAINSDTTDFACGTLRAGTGVASDPLDAPNPSAFAGPGIFPVYLDNNGVACAITSAARAQVAIASIRSTGLAWISANWTEPPAAWRTQALIGEAATRQRAERNLVAMAAAFHVATKQRAVQATSQPVHVGDLRSFYIIDPQAPATSGDPPGTLTLCEARYVQEANGGGESLVVWVDRADAGIFPDATLPTEIGRQVADHISPLTSCAFGAEPSVAALAGSDAEHRPAIRDDYLHLVFSHLVDHGTATSGDGTLGFFALADLLSSADNAASNQDKVLYLAASTTSRDPRDLFAVIAHEFQHLLFSSHRIATVGLHRHLAEYGSSQISWLNEGLSMVSMFLNGFGPRGDSASPAIVDQIAMFLSYPGDFSLLDFTASSGHGAPYGMTALFFQYLLGRLGDECLLQFHLLDNSAQIDPANPAAADPTSLAQGVLALHGTSLAAMFADFAGALLVDGTPLESQEAIAARYRIPGVAIHYGRYQGTQGEVALDGPAMDVSGSATLQLKPFALAFRERTGLARTPATLEFGGRYPASGANFAARLVSWP